LNTKRELRKNRILNHIEFKII